MLLVASIDICRLTATHVSLNIFPEQNFFRNSCCFIGLPWTTILLGSRTFGTSSGFARSAMQASRMGCSFMASQVKPAARLVDESVNSKETAVVVRIIGSSSCYCDINQVHNARANSFPCAAAGRLRTPLDSNFPKLLKCWRTGSGGFTSLMCSIQRQILNRLHANISVSKMSSNVLGKAHNQRGRTRPAGFEGSPTVCRNI